jgi:hypothetical protein
MSHTAWELRAFRNVASEIAEVIAAHGYRVGLAHSLHRSFHSGYSQLYRDLVLDAASEAASRDGVLDFRPVNGTGREFQLWHDGVDRRYRLKRATKTRSGYRIVHGSNSAVLGGDDGQPELFPSEQWVLAWTLDRQAQVGNVFVASVIDVADGKPGRLVLGPTTELLDESRTSAPQSFTPDADDALPGFEDLDDELGDDEQEWGSTS